MLRSVLLSFIFYFAHAVTAADLPEWMKPIDSKLLVNGELSLQSLKGSVKLPLGNWVWYKDTRASGKSKNEISLGANPETGQVMVVTLVPGERNIRSAKVEHFRSDVMEMISPLGGVILSENGQLIAIPNHPEVFHVKSRVKIYDNEFDHERYVIPSGSYSTILSTLYVTEAESDRAMFKSMASSLTFTSARKQNPLLFLYIVVGGVLWMLFLIINSAVGRTLLSPATVGLVGVILTLSIRLIYLTNQPYDGSGKSAGYKTGYEMGLAFFPFVILVFMIAWEKKLKREEEARKKAREEALRAEASESKLSDGE